MRCRNILSQSTSYVIARSQCFDVRYFSYIKVSISYSTLGLMTFTNRLQAQHTRSHISAVQILESRIIRCFLPNLKSSIILTIHKRVYLRYIGNYRPIIITFLFSNNLNRFSVTPSITTSLLPTYSPAQHEFLKK